MEYDPLKWVKLLHFKPGDAEVPVDAQAEVLNALCVVIMKAGSLQRFYSVIPVWESQLRLLCPPHNTTANTMGITLGPNTAPGCCIQLLSTVKTLTHLVLDVKDLSSIPPQDLQGMPDVYIFEHLKLLGIRGATEGDLSFHLKLLQSCQFPSVKELHIQTRSPSASLEHFLLVRSLVESLPELASLHLDGKKTWVKAVLSKPTVLPRELWLESWTSDGDGNRILSQAVEILCIGSIHDEPPAKDKDFLLMLYDTKPERKAALKAVMLKDFVWRNAILSAQHAALTGNVFAHSLRLETRGIRVLDACGQTFRETPGFL